MKQVIFGLAIIIYIFVCAKADEYENIEKPLLLTPWIEDGKINEVRDKAVVKHPQFKDIKSYSGYLTINKLYNSNTFFWYFPSQRNTQNDPLLVWMNGGPGSTSLLGLFGENGPFIITENGTVEMRKYSWHVNHNIIYIDNPVGSGYSFTENDLGYITSYEQAGDNLLTALIQFFQLFPELKSNDFYVTGESYAGKYIPAVCHAIKMYNQHAESKINLKGLAIGNGAIDPINQISYYSDELFAIGLIDSRERDQIRLLEKKMRILITQEKYVEATDVIDSLFLRYFSSGPSLFKNMTGFDFYYNYLQTEEPKVVKQFVDWVTKYDVRQALHVGNFEFNSSSQIVKEYLKEDITRSAAHFVADLLEDYKVLIYHGQTDIIISYIGTEKFIENLNWSGVDDFKTAQKELWRFGDDIAGYSKTARKLTFVLVRNGGHYLPTDQPLWAWDMITRFTHNLGF